MPDDAKLDGHTPSLPLFQDSSDNTPEDPSAPFVGRWNKLISVTNWEKGRIIHEWREALKGAAAKASDCSDDAWAQHVGGVTGQHVGRLRRVYERFGDVYEEYPNLFWSHFCASIDWDDAEMWLEGGVQNRWSVAQMRERRAETLGTVVERSSTGEDIVATESDEDASFVAIVDEGEHSVLEGADASPPQSVEGEQEDVPAARPGGDTPPVNTASADPTPVAEAAEMGPANRVRPFEDLVDLPAGLAEATEQFKVAILAHKLAGWEQIGRQRVLDCLEALKELTLAPSE